VLGLPTRRRVALLGVTVAAVVALGACGATSDPAEDAVEQALETELGGDAQVDVDGDSLTVDTGDGTLTAGSGEVPADFPSAVPLVDGEVAFAQRSESPESTGWTVQISTPAVPDDVVDKLTRALPEAGFTVEPVPGQGGTTLLAEGNGLSVLVLVAAGEDGGSSVLYTVDGLAAP
jgi:hypothetical protein